MITFIDFTAIWTQLLDLGKLQCMILMPRSGFWGAGVYKEGPEHGKGHGLATPVRDSKPGCLALKSTS